MKITIAPEKTGEIANNNKNPCFQQIFIIHGLLQVYKGLDIITAKVTEEERSLAPHHMLDFVDPLHNYCVIDFKKAALPIVSFYKNFKAL